MKMTKKILIVDDEAGIRDTLFYNLSDNGFTVDTAKNGREALEKITNNKYNAVLSDIVMDESDGVNLLENIKKYDPNLSVILFTGYASLETSIPAVNKGAFAYLKKPVSIEEIITALNSAITKNYDDNRKEKVFGKYVKLLKYRKMILKEKLSKIFNCDTKKNFDSIRKSAMVINRNKTAKILILTHNKTISENLIIQLKSAGFFNIGTAHELSDSIINCREIFLFDAEYYRENLDIYVNHIRRINQNAKIIVITKQNDTEFKEKYNRLNINAFIESPANFTDLLKVVSWESYLSESDIMRDKINHLSLFRHILADIKYFMFKKVQWKLSFTILFTAWLLGLVISHPKTYILIRELKDYSQSYISDQENIIIAQKISSQLNNKQFSDTNVLSLLSTEYNVPLQAVNEEIHKNYKNSKIKQFSENAQIINENRKNNNVQKLKSYINSIGFEELIKTPVEKKIIILNNSNPQITEISDIDSTVNKINQSKDEIIKDTINNYKPSLSDKTMLFKKISINNKNEIINSLTDSSCNFKTLDLKKENIEFNSMRISLTLSEWKKNINKK